MSPTWQFRANIRRRLSAGARSPRRVLARTRCPTRRSHTPFSCPVPRALTPQRVRPRRVLQTAAPSTHGRKTRPFRVTRRVRHVCLDLSVRLGLTGSDLI